MINSTDVNNKVKDVIYLDDIKPGLEKAFKEGFKMGESTYFNTLQNTFRIMKGHVILFGGIGNYGKSKFLKQICLLRAIKNNEKFAVFTPEENPPEYFYMDLIHTYMGLSPYKWHHNQMTLEQFQQGMDFVKDHFYFLYPEFNNPTPKYINERFQETINIHKVDGCITDPFNQLVNDWEQSGRDDRYINSYLMDEKRFALRNNVYKFTVHHTKGNIQKDDLGNYKMPSVYDLSGGAMWNNGCDDIIFIHRPFRESDPDSDAVVFKSAKIKKQILCGTPGEVQFGFDILKNRYLEHGLSPFDKSHEKVNDIIEEIEIRDKIDNDVPY